ncbi:MAG: peptidoglycan DD-metalloendopeptidase family protein [Lachnospiraceae bacterium]|nr:peptidoglycan DD-metalloendopeptidase family protein [Lachnospiraceae bacterium]
MQKNKKVKEKKNTRQRAAPVKDKVGVKASGRNGLKKRLYDLKLFFNDEKGFNPNNPDSGGFSKQQDAALFRRSKEKKHPLEEKKGSRDGIKKKRTRSRIIKEVERTGKSESPKGKGEETLAQGDPGRNTTETSTPVKEDPKPESTAKSSTYNFIPETENRLKDDIPKAKREAYRRFLYVKGRSADKKGFSWRGAKRAAAACVDFMHEVNGEEDDNSATEAVGSSIRTGSRVQDFVIDRIPKRRNRRSPNEDQIRRKRRKKRNTGFRKNGGFYSDNGFRNRAGNKETDPGHAETGFIKQLRKKQIKRDYAKAYRKARENAERTVKTIQKAAQTTAAVARKLAEAAAANAHALIVAGIIFILLLIIMTGISSCAAMFGAGIADVMAGTYQSLPAEIDKVDESMTLKEMELQEQIDRIEADYPDYDEYSYNLATIGHNPYTLINFLSAKYVEFTAADVESEIQDLFDEMYDLDISEREETRTRTVTKTRKKVDPDTGEETDEDEEYEDEEEYSVKILEVTLTSTPLETVISPELTGETGDLYQMYRETEGARQEFYTPLDLDWRSCIKSYYGYRKNPLTGARQFHRGLDLSVPEGTNVYASQSGTVVTADYDEDYGIYIVIADSGGYMTKYAHLESSYVSSGQTVRHGQLIGKTGSTGSITGSHLHIECLYNGEYYNPLFYFENGEGSLYDSDAPEAPGDSDVAALLNEAKKYLGYPYVWGGSNPSTSFDCSGFVCWALTTSGFADMPRTTAQGIYNRCTPIDAADAQAGDIIFFTGTYKSGNPVSHVGIYCGNGIMIHAGDPIKYSNINTPYWQAHFYGFARVPR